VTIDKTLTNEAYHAHPAISSSDVKAVYKTSLLHWKHKVYTSSPAFDLGSAVHALVLEADKDLVVRGPADRRGNKWKEARADADLDGKILLTEGDFDVARAMADSLLDTKIGQRMAGDQVINEASFFATDPDIVIDLKTRPDSYWPQEGVIYDIKTCQDASPAGFERDLRKYAYDLQAAFYMHVLRLSGCKAKNFVFACVEKQPPYAVGVHAMTWEYLDWAEKRVMETLRKIQLAEKTGMITTGWPEINYIDLPAWLQDADVSADLDDFDRV
jgi:exodeoxyribonuclease VIII